MVAMVIRVFTGGIICFVATLSSIKLVWSRLSSNKLKHSALYLNLHLPSVWSPRSPLPCFFNFLVIVVCSVLLPSLMAFAGIYSDFCLVSAACIAAANNASAGTGGVLQIPPHTRLMIILEDGLGVWTPVGLPFFPRGRS